MNYRKITTVTEAAQLHAGTTVFINDAGTLKQAKLALLSTGGAMPADDKSVTTARSMMELVGFNSAAAGTVATKGTDGKLTWTTPASADVGELTAKVDAIQEILEPTTGATM